MTRWSLRRGDSAREPDGSREVRADFAGVLDGRSLWIAVPVQLGRLALRTAGTDDLLDLPSEQVTDQPDHLAVRLDLSVLDGTEGRYDVVLVPPKGVPVVVGSDPLPPTTTRPGLDGRTQHLLVTTPEEALQIRTTVLPAAAGLLAVRKLDGAIELTLLDAGPELAILAEDPDGADDQVLASWPVDDAGVVSITRESVEHLGPLTRPAMTGRPGAWLPVRRRANDLVDPRIAAPLPQVDAADGDRPRLRIPWSREALLLVRVFADDLADDQAGDQAGEP